MAKNGKYTQDDVTGWRAKLHQVEFTEAEVSTLKVLVEADERSILDVITDVAVDNCGIKIKSVEAYDCYSFSYTLDKHHPKLPGHTFWFYDNDPGRGIRIMSAFVAELLEDHMIQGMTQRRNKVW